MTAKTRPERRRLRLGELILRERRQFVVGAIGRGVEIVEGELVLERSLGLTGKIGEIEIILGERIDLRCGRGGRRTARRSDGRRQLAERTGSATPAARRGPEPASWRQREAAPGVRRAGGYPRARPAARAGWRDHPASGPTTRRSSEGFSGGAAGGAGRSRRGCTGSPRMAGT